METTHRMYLVKCTHNTSDMSTCTSRKREKVDWTPTQWRIKKRKRKSERWYALARSLSVRTPCSACLINAQRPNNNNRFKERERERTSAEAWSRYIANYDVTMKSQADFSIGHQICMWSTTPFLSTSKRGLRAFPLVLRVNERHNNSKQSPTMPMHRCKLATKFYFISCAQRAPPTKNTVEHFVTLSSEVRACSSVASPRFFFSFLPCRSQCCIPAERFKQCAWQKKKKKTNKWPCTGFFSSFFVVVVVVVSLLVCTLIRSCRFISLHFYCY